MCVRARGGGSQGRDGGLFTDRALNCVVLQHLSSFSVPPIGPIGAFVKVPVKHESWLKALEETMGEKFRTYLGKPQKRVCFAVRAVDPAAATVRQCVDAQWPAATSPLLVSLVCVVVVAVNNLADGHMLTRMARDAGMESKMEFSVFRHTDRMPVVSDRMPFFSALDCLDADKMHPWLYTFVLDQARLDKIVRHVRCCLCAAS